MTTRRRRCRRCSTPAHKKGGMVLSTHDDEARSTIDSTTGGIMTAEVGAITGELEVATRSLKGGLIEVAVRNAGEDRRRKRASDLTAEVLVNTQWQLDSPLRCSRDGPQYTYASQTLSNFIFVSLSVSKALNSISGFVLRE